MIFRPTTVRDMIRARVPERGIRTRYWSPRQISMVTTGRDAEPDRAGTPALSWSSNSCVISTCLGELYPFRVHNPHSPV
jgi:hypothetical protein